MSRPPGRLALFCRLASWSQAKADDRGDLPINQGLQNGRFFACLACLPKPGSPPPNASLLRAFAGGHGRRLTYMKTGYLIDMDGVIYRENHLIAGADEFVRALTATGTPFLFLTNNSAPTRMIWWCGLKHLGIHGLTRAALLHLGAEHGGFSLFDGPQLHGFALGEGGLLAALNERKIPNDAIRPHYVVVGEGAISMEKLTKAHECIERGARLLATNPDNWCPVSTK